MEASIRGFEKKYSNIIELTDTPTKLSIETMYRHLAHQANNSSIPMRSLQEVERGHPIHPDSATNDLHPQVLERHSATLFHKLETLVPETAPTYHGTVAQNTSGENGYATLHQILRTVLPKLQDFRPKWGPSLDKNQDMFRFVRVMQEHATSEAGFNRPYKDLEIITNIIQHTLDDNNRYEMTARTAKATIQSALAQGTRVILTMQNIAQNLEPSRTRHQANDGGDVPTMHKFDERRPQSLDPKKQVQCRSCQAWGHNGQRFMMCKIMNITKWIKENPDEAEKQATMFAQSNSKRMVNILQVENEAELYEGIESMCTALCDEPAPTMKKMQAPNDWEAAAAEYLAPMSGALQPFQAVPECIDASRVQSKSNTLNTRKTMKVTMQTMAINLQPMQEDTAPC
jgi:hypothetical protein